MTRTHRRLVIGLFATFALLAGCDNGNALESDPPISPDLARRAALAEQSAAAGSTLVGKPAPAFSATNQAGRPTTLEQFRGQWLVLYFYPVGDMPPCTCDATKYTKALIGLDKTDGAVMYGVTTCSPQSLRAFNDLYKVNMKLLSDPDRKMLRDYRAADDGSERINRATVIIDPQGVVRYHWPLVVPVGHPQRVQEKLNELKSGPATQPQG